MLDATQLGLRLRSTRERRGLSQQAVAQALNLQRTAVTNIESGTRAVSTLELGRLADLYDAKPEMLWEPAALPPSSGEAQVVRLRGLYHGLLDDDATRAIDHVIGLCR